MSALSSTTTSILEEIKPHSLSPFSPRRTLKTGFRSPYHASLLRQRQSKPPETSCGNCQETVNGVSRWMLKNDAAKDWENIREELFREFDGNHGTIYHKTPMHDRPSLFCWMLGESKVSAAPYVIVRHLLQVVASRAMDVAKKFLDIHEYGFGVGYIDKPFERIAGFEIILDKYILASEGCIDACGVGFNVRGNYENAHIGSGEFAAQASTIGGIINLPPLPFYHANTVHGVTVSHAFSIIQNDHTPSIFVDDHNQSSSVLGDKDLHLFGSTGQKSVLKTPVGSETTEYQGSTSSRILPTVRTPTEPHTRFQSASLRDNPELLGYPADWATITSSFPADRGINRIHNQRQNKTIDDQEQTLATNFVTEISLQPPREDLIILTKRGILRGVGLGKIYSKGSRKKITYGDEWAVEVTAGVLKQGDSGSWVVDAKTGELYGILTAAILSMGVGRILPARAIQYDLLAHNFAHSSGDQMQILHEIGRPIDTDSLSSSVEEPNADLYSDQSWCPFRFLPSLADIYCTAARFGDVQVLEQVDQELFSQYHIETSTNGRLPLVEACRGNHVVTVEYLIQRGANPNSTDGRHLSLIECVKHKNYELCLLLLKAGADPDAYDKSETSPISAANNSQWTVGLDILHKTSIALLRPIFDENPLSDSASTSAPAESIFSMGPASVHSSNTNQESFAGGVNPPSVVMGLGNPPNMGIWVNTRKEQISSRFKVHRPQEYVQGIVFKVIWSEPKGVVTGASNISSNPTSSTFGDEAYVSMRRFIVVVAMKGHCICVPILTYGRLATTKEGVNPENHAIVFTGNGVPPLLRGEQELGMKPIRVDPHPQSEKLDPLSRINYAKPYTVEYNLKTSFVGSVHRKYLFLLSSSYNAVHHLLDGPEDENTDPENDDIDQY